MGGFYDPESKGKPLEILDEGVTVNSDVRSLDFVGDGVQATGDTDVEVAVTGGGGGIFYDQSVSPTNGQTSFSLDFLPTNNSSVFMIINGITFTPGKGFIISGTTITWGESFTIQDSDKIVIRFKKS